MGRRSEGRGNWCGINDPLNVGLKDGNGNEVTFALIPLVSHTWKIRRSACATETVPCESDQHNRQLTPARRRPPQPDGGLRLSWLAIDGRRYSIHAMSWGEVELDPEVRDWYLDLGEEDQARVGFHVDRLAEMGRCSTSRSPSNWTASSESCGSTSADTRRGSRTGSLRNAGSSCSPCS